MSKRTAIYCRVSTKEQTTENQKRDLIRYCEQRELSNVEVFDAQIWKSIYTEWGARITENTEKSRF